MYTCAMLQACFSHDIRRLVRMLANGAMLKVCVKDFFFPESLSSFFFPSKFTACESSYKKLSKLGDAVSGGSCVKGLFFILTALTGDILRERSR